MELTVIIYYKGILGEIEEGGKIVNRRHALPIILLLFDFYIIFAFKSVLKSLFEFFASIHLLDRYLVVFS